MINQKDRSTWPIQNRHLIVDRTYKTHIVVRRNNQAASLLVRLSLERGKEEEIMHEHLSLVQKQEK